MTFSTGPPNNSRTARSLRTMRWPTGRYDRYSNEYARAIYDAAELAGRQDIMKAVAPSLKEQMKLWWDLLSVDGYGYSWGEAWERSAIWTQWRSPLFSAFTPSSGRRRSLSWPPCILPHGHGSETTFNGQTHLLSVFALAEVTTAISRRNANGSKRQRFSGK